MQGVYVDKIPWVNTMINHAAEEVLFHEQFQGAGSLDIVSGHRPYLFTS